jgi:hypothetical protein
VAETVSPTPVQVVHPVGAAEPAVSNDATDPAGGNTSIKFTEKTVPELPDILSVNEDVPLLPVRL